MYTVSRWVGKRCAHKWDPEALWHRSLRQVVSLNLFLHSCHEAQTCLRPCSLIQDPVNYSLVNTLKLYELKPEMWRFRVRFANCPFAQYIICWFCWFMICPVLNTTTKTKFSCCFVWAGLKMSMESQVKHWTIISQHVNMNVFLSNIIEFTKDSSSFIRALEL